MSGSLCGKLSFPSRLSPWRQRVPCISQCLPGRAAHSILGFHRRYRPGRQLVGHVGWGFAAWSEAGGTHVSVATLGLGFDFPEAHLDYCPRSLTHWAGADRARAERTGQPPVPAWEPRLAGYPRRSGCSGHDQHRYWSPARQADGDRADQPVHGLRRTADHDRHVVTGSVIADLLGRSDQRVRDRAQPAGEHPAVVAPAQLLGGLSAQVLRDLVEGGFRFRDGGGRHHLGGGQLRDVEHLNTAFAATHQVDRGVQRPNGGGGPVVPNNEIEVSASRQSPGGGSATLFHCSQRAELTKVPSFSAKPAPGRRYTVVLICFISSVVVPGACQKALVSSG